jgi:hypothetical protein
MEVDDLLDLILSFEVALGTLGGIAAAALVHWAGPRPDPVLLESLLVAAGFCTGVFWSYRSGQSDE